MSTLFQNIFEQFSSVLSTVRAALIKQVENGLKSLVLSRLGHRHRLQKEAAGWPETGHTGDK